MYFIFLLFDYSNGLDNNNGLEYIYVYMYVYEMDLKWTRSGHTNNKSQLLFGFATCEKNSGAEKSLSESEF